MSSGYRDLELDYTQDNDADHYHDQDKAARLTFHDSSLLKLRSILLIAPVEVKKNRYGIFSFLGRSAAWKSLNHQDLLRGCDRDVGFLLSGVTLCDREYQSFLSGVGGPCDHVAVGRGGESVDLDDERAMNTRCQLLRTAERKGVTLPDIG
ncbi:MAG: hypothetical protein D6723_05920 [Acidobacteria bacterium]|nr:MAG: hypothetical protein D6723_05920 [Acidobacteriota bacterium]